ncbi:unnamed protein product [Didymodactylos carnosus]|uniref:Uncharacterized protein n=1 Tax=Didymodactylos carnosus TaxID=1234261 RepID=A0A8S2DZI5_9BILA|nr:unnamed protein product [Didymodactylos carnosus]CAF3776434.1 unnamed protein product [Didymodactylos carnosus]
MTSCKLLNDEDHALWFVHRTKCPSGGECKLLIEDPAHSNEFEHPQVCHEGGQCNNLSSEHLKAFRHVPLCRYGVECVEFNRGTASSHCKEFRHCKPMCRQGHFCVRFHDQKHMTEESHPFQPPCPFTPFYCRHHTLLSEVKNIQSLPPETQNHCLHFSHVCRYGRNCHEASELHWEKTIHIARNLCPYGNRCSKTTQEDHLNSFSHPNIADIRRLCVNPAYECPNRRTHDHIIRYRHNGNFDRSGVIRYFGLNMETNFVKNQESIIAAINDYNKKPLTKIPPEILKWIRGLQHVHRCSKVIFESILVHGHVMSREHMEHLLKPQFVAQAVQQHRRVQKIFDRHKIQTIEDRAKEYIRAIVNVEYAKKANVLPPSTGIGAGITSTSEENDCIIRRNETILSTLTSQEDVDIIRRCATEIAEASLNLHANPAGIGYVPDKALGTDRHVFSILGPHLGHYYGDIVLVFKHELKHHPDANFSMQAATSYSSGRNFTHRAWIKDSNTAEGRVKQFHGSKLHCSVPG